MRRLAARSLRPGIIALCPIRPDTGTSCVRLCPLGPDTRARTSSVRPRRPGARSRAMSSSALKRKSASLAAGEPKKAKVNGNIASFFGASPKPKPSAAAAAAAPAAAKFDKAKWVAGLTAEQRELLRLEIDTLHDSWLALLRDELTTREFLDLKRFLERETAAGKTWFPPRDDVYSWSRHTPFDSVKVVVVGQDPYHNHNQAHGMAFSVRPPTPAPPSLRNVYTALRRDYPSFAAPAGNGGLLTPWADRGVLLLNTCLTVRAHEANSHANRGWERFTQRVIDLVAQRRARGVVFMAWGTPAGKRVLRVDRDRHLVLQSVHPSPLSAARGFFDCGHFRKANDWLVARYGPGADIDWALTPGSSTKEREPAEADAKPVRAPSAGEADAETAVAKGADDDIDSGDEEALAEALERAEESKK
ncbi:hypothetical protein CDD83_5342 [Cordyceps sp. RAO-2017]|nr:hypothetical protein CDD83_5342 [Cordyceps sp. RAO-2017]